MSVKFVIKKLFAYSKTNNKYFYTEFIEGTNIIYGKNTAGKSTIFQSIFYTIGINDNKEYLREIIEEDLIFRLDGEMWSDNKREKITFIREDEIMYIKEEDKLVIVFNGINGDSSAEHIKLKEYINNLFGFTLKLESKNEYKAAPIETIFLPYYISQSVGWVYLRKSFNNLDFYKNFKEDYLDYYLGIENCIDREKRKDLQKRLQNNKEETRFYTNMETENETLQIAKLVDEDFLKESENYIEVHKDKQINLRNKEEEYISRCNEFSYYQKRLSVLKKVSSHHKNQKPKDGECPICKQSLQFSVNSIYKYHQEENDTEAEIIKCKNKRKEIQSKINSLKKNIEDSKKDILKEYNILQKYSKHNFSFNSWMESKVNVRVINDIKYKLGELNIDRVKIEEGLKQFKTEEEVIISRRSKEKEFSYIFLKLINELKVKELKEDRYKSLYKISAFPSQGVELHKTVLSYNFAFNELIIKTEGIHRLPFMLDAIFKEDIEQDNRDLIVEFIAKHKPKDTQVIFSIAEIKENEKTIDNYNIDYFNGEAKLICIGKGVKERSFLEIYDNSRDYYLEETLEIMNI